MTSRKKSHENPRVETSGSPSLLTSPGDLTMRQMAGEILGTSDSLLHSILDQSPYPMWIADAQGTLIWLNQACRDLLHLTAAEVVGKYNVFQDNIVEQQGHLPLLRRVFEKGETVRFELAYNTSLLKTLQLQTAASVILDVTVSPVLDRNGKITHAIFQHVDITDRKRAEAALAESEQRFKIFMDHLPAAVFIKDQESRLLFANRYLREIFGWEDCLGKTTEELVPPEHAAHMVADDRRALAAGSTVNQERITDAHGVEHFFDTYKFPVLDDAGPVLLGGIAVDVTERQRAAEALELSEKKYRSFYQSILDGFVSVDLDGNIVETNQAYLEMIGYTAEEVRGLRYQDITPAKWHKFEANIIEQQVLTRGYSDTYEKEYIRKDGTVFPVELRAYLLKDKAGAAADMWAFVRDITDRKRTEEALKKEELLTEAILDSLPGTFFLLDSQGQQLRTNRSEIEITGYSREELTDMHALESLAEEDRPAAQRALEEVLEKGEASLEAQMLTKDGRKIPFFFTAKKFIIGDMPYILGTGMDITARKEMEEALRESQEYLKTVMESVGTGIVVVDAETRQIVDINPFAAKIIGSPREEIIGNVCHEHICPAEIGKCPVMDLGLTVDQSERSILTGCGQTLPILKTVTHFQKEGRKYLLESFLDISERKQAEEALRESEKKYRTLYHEFQAILNAIPDTLCLISPDLRIVWGNEATSACTPQHGLAETLGQHCYQLRQDKAEPCENCPVERCFRSGRLETEENTAQGYDWELRAFPVYDDQGELMGAVELARNITARKRIEKALQESEEQLRLALQAANQGFYDLNIQTGESKVSPEYATMLGYDPGNFQETSARWMERLHPDDREQVLATYQAYIRGDIPDFAVEFRQRTESGEWKWILSLGKIVAWDEDGKPLRMLGTLTDITERKNAEEALRESEKRLKEAQEMAHLGFWYWNVKTGEVTWSEEVYKIFQLDPKEFTPNIDSILELSPWPEERARDQELIRQAMESHEKGTYEQRFILPDKSIGHYYSTFQGKYDEGGNLIFIVGTVLDITERKKAEEALRESEKKYRSLYHEFQGFLNTIPDTVCLLSPDLEIVWANQVPAAREGIPNISEIGKHCYPQRHGRSEPCENCPVLRCFSSGKMETAVTTAHGRTWELRAFPIYDDHGEVRGGLEVARDITARQEMEEALRESEARFRQVVESSPLPIGIGNEDGSTDYVNPKFVETLGYTLEDLPRLEDWFRLAYPDPAYRQSLISKWQKAWERIKENGLTEVVEVEITCKDGSKRIMQLFGTLMDNKSLVVFNDLTERKRMEEALRENEKKYRSLYQEFQGILNAIPDILCLLSPDLRIVWGNEATAIHVGKSNISEVIGKHCYPLRHERSEPCENCPALRCFSSGEIETEEVISFGEFYELRAVPLYDDQGESRGAIEVARNITERKLAEAERTRLEAQMREVQKLESLGVLAGGIAHDFNNLLMAILGNADLAMLSLSPASPARPHVEEISRGSLRAADLCRQMLAYSGKGRFVIGRYDLAEIVQEMAQMLKVSVSKKASLRYSFAADLPAVEVDATQMRQVIMNLIINASEALEDQNGFISVATGIMDCDRAFLAESYLDDKLPDGKYVYLEVADTGCGMDDETRRRIFDPFFTTKFTGRGLGLAAVLGIVRGHQGAIKVYSEPGQGTTFKVLLPAVEWAPGDRPVSTAPTSQSLPGGTILLVDDDPHVRQVASQMLERLGFKVLTATHGREGLEVFKTNRGQIDCVILDLTMPEMAGDEVFRELRRLRKGVRVILSSGFNEQDVTQRFAGKGVAGFIQKPYTVKILQETLYRVLEPQ